MWNSTHNGGFGQISLQFPFQWKESWRIQRAGGFKLFFEALESRLGAALLTKQTNHFINKLTNPYLNV